MATRFPAFFFVVVVINVFFFDCSSRVFGALKNIGFLERFSDTLYDYGSTGVFNGKAVA